MSLRPFDRKITALLLFISIDSFAIKYKAKCPDEAFHLPLVHSDVFDGPPSEIRSLYPDKGNQKTGSIWEVKSIYENKRKVYLSCTYGPYTETELMMRTTHLHKGPIYVMVKDQVDFCRWYHDPKTQKNELGCW